jgi:hypothetical protein
MVETVLLNSTTCESVQVARIGSSSMRRTTAYPTSKGADQGLLEGTSTGGLHHRAPDHGTRDALRDVHLLIADADARSTIRQFARAVGDARSSTVELPPDGKQLDAWFPRSGEAPFWLQPAEARVSGNVTSESTPRRRQGEGVRLPGA